MERDDTPGRVVEAAVERPLDVLAELELVRRKSELFERRLASWEAGLLELRQRLHALETARDPETPTWHEALNDLKHRVDRLERRRRKQAVQAPAGGAVGDGPSSPLPPIPPVEGAVAIVKGRWSTSHASPGEEVELKADTDGIEDGTVIALAVHALNSSHPVDHVKATAEGGRLTAKWTVPRGTGPTELFFEIDHAGVQTRSSLMVIE